VRAGKFGGGNSGCRRLPRATAADRFEDLLLIAEFLCARESLACGLAGTCCAIIARSGMGTAISARRWTMKTLRLIFGASAGKRLFERVFRPGLTVPMGGAMETSSRVIPMQVTWNLLVSADNGISPRGWIAFRKRGDPSARTDGSASVARRTTGGWSAGGGGNLGQTA